MMTIKPEDYETEQRLPFPEGFPAPPTDELLDAIEQVLIYRAEQRGIRSIGLQDASMPIAAGLKRDALLPVMVDYLTNTIYKQSELHFESDLMDTLAIETLEHRAGAENGEQCVDADVKNIQSDIAQNVQRPMLYNHSDDEGLLFASTGVSPVATIPASVTFLMLDAALESAHNLSMTHQQNLAGITEKSELDLTPVLELLARLDINNSVIAPPALHVRLSELREKALYRQSTFGYIDMDSQPDPDMQESQS